ncbi:uncharacterized protein TRIADDRAFT_24205 [Trichoplax adhaerens]|uniref:Phospholipid scramblase n=1 Tax=Trichoplax adhaerens TaxID=10228 RepID=B3RTR2_TRIAD|nr:hypothetical protein TRIADDRAFT_24205 [Trichoplax adhaerens]EDV26177.1 hypothetical protein TRIADDRAFT_24205 [Trichoplax adhaerens]|eukprot:XP_002112210.1 hypothetical protein TRIADDRAFT_24205 [Trichoplax adhaerens]
MAPPPSIAGCPPGLEYLTQIDQLLIHQLVELLELFTNWETHNRYMVKNSMGQQVYFAAEQNDCLTLQCCGPLRSFEMSICDNNNREIIHLVRPLRCSCCCCPCCLQELEVQSPPGTPIGYIEQQWSVIFPEFKILDANRNPVLRIKGPFCPCSCFGDVNFEVLPLEGETPVGKITKQWSGFLKEAYTDADNFGITFPMDLDVKIKATLLGAVFLIDFMFFEDNQNNRNN